jgi:hypothetical protein
MDPRTVGKATHLREMAMVTRESSHQREKQRERERDREMGREEEALFKKNPHPFPCFKGNTKEVCLGSEWIEV